MKKVLITVVGGVISLDGKPDNVELEIRDYDIEDDFDGQCGTDEEGDRYQKIIFPEKKEKST